MAVPDSCRADVLSQPRRRCRQRARVRPPRIQESPDKPFGEAGCGSGGLAESERNQPRLLDCFSRPHAVVPTVRFGILRGFMPTSDSNMRISTTSTCSIQIVNLTRGQSAARCHTSPLLSVGRPTRAKTNQSIVAGVRSWLISTCLPLARRPAAIRRLRAKPPVDRGPQPVPPFLASPFASLLSFSVCLVPPRSAEPPTLSRVSP
jgi:hypothetical protein